MTNDRGTAHRFADFHARARDIGLMEMLAYEKWSARKLREGESPARITPLDMVSMLPPGDNASVIEAEFDELLDDHKGTVDPYLTSA